MSTNFQNIDKKAYAVLIEKNPYTSDVVGVHQFEDDESVMKFLIDKCFDEDGKLKIDYSEHGGDPYNFLLDVEEIKKKGCAIYMLQELNQNWHRCISSFYGKLGKLMIPETIWSTRERFPRVKNPWYYEAYTKKIKSRN